MAYILYNLTLQDTEFDQHQLLYSIDKYYDDVPS